MALGKREGGVKTFNLLDQMLTIMGTTKTTLFPFLETSEDETRAYKESSHVLAAQSGGPGFDAYAHAGGIHSYLFDATYNMCLKGPDSTDFEFGDASVDVPFSIGLWILPNDIASVTLMAKYDTNDKREWKLEIDGSGDLEIEFFDETVNKTEIGTSTTGVTADKWTSIVVTYDGDETGPVIGIYQDAVADGTTGTTEDADYIAMEPLSAPLTIGAHLATDAPTAPFDGRIALPFVCGKLLTAAEVTALYNIGRTLMGLG